MISQKKAKFDFNLIKISFDSKIGPYLGFPLIVGLFFSFTLSAFCYGSYFYPENILPLNYTIFNELLYEIILFSFLSILFLIILICIIFSKKRSGVSFIEILLVFYTTFSMVLQTIHIYIAYFQGNGIYHFFSQYPFIIGCLCFTLTCILLIYTILFIIKAIKYIRSQKNEKK